MPRHTIRNWRKVDVGLADASTDTNHYDDGAIGAFAEDDLEASDDHHDAGIFYSLEVLQDYTVARQEDDTSGIRVEDIATCTESKEPSTSANRPTSTAVASKDLTSSSSIAEETESSTTAPSFKKPVKKRKRKRKDKKDSSSTTPSTVTDVADDSSAVAAALALQQTWLRATQGVPLPLPLCQRLLPFPHPTPIQAAVLAPAILGQSNIVGAAPTGSGKTLAFLLPILTQLWEQQEEQQQTTMTATESVQQEELPANAKQRTTIPYVQALILTPTRELAKQIYQQAVALTQPHRSWVGCFTGGLALVKQERVLQQQRPALLIGTPGRVWDLLQHKDQYEHLQRLERIQFLVLDEADRMMGTSQASFPEVHKILNVVERADTGVVKRRTLLFSATLTLKGEGTQRIMEQTKAKGKIKVVDLSQGADEAASGSGKLQTKKQKSKPNTFQLPPGLKLLQVQCTQRHKDSHLYAYLMLQQESALVFCNSIAAVRRVGQTMRVLGWSVRILHAHMPQRARFQAVESLNTQNTIVIATDVAARGLDWTAIPTIVHYDAARTMESFVHRAGRTARGIGGRAVGSSLSLIAPSEDKFHSQLVQQLGLSFETIRMDGRILRESQERVCLASKVAAADDTDRQRTRDQQWFQEQARDAGIELESDDDDDLLDGSRGGAKRADVAGSRQRLAQLLQQPLQIQRHGKFLSTSSNAMQLQLATPVVAGDCATAQTKTKKAKRRRRR